MVILVALVFQDFQGAQVLVEHLESQAIQEFQVLVVLQEQVAPLE